MNWLEHKQLQRGIRKEFLHDVAPFPDKLFDGEPREARVGEYTTTAMTHDVVTGRSMHFIRKRK